MVHSEEVNVRGIAVPVIIGVQGASIRKLQEEYDVSMKFLGLNTEQYAERPLRIIGQPQNVENAVRRIADISAGRDLEFYVTPPSPAASVYNPPSLARSVPTTVEAAVPSTASFMVTREFFAPSKIAHRVIGKDNENLNNIKTSQNLRYAEAEGLRVVDDGREMQQIVLRGVTADVENALSLLKQLVDLYAAEQMHADEYYENEKNGDVESIGNYCNSRNEIDEDFWCMGYENDNNDKTSTSGASTVGEKNKQLADSHAAGQMQAGKYYENKKNGDIGSISNCHNSRNEIDEDFWGIVYENDDNDKTSTSGVSTVGAATATNINPSLLDPFDDVNGTDSGFSTVKHDHSRSNGAKYGLIVDVSNDKMYDSEPLAYTVKYNPNTNGLLHEPRQAEISKFAVRISSLGEQHNNIVERASRAHCDDIVKAVLEFVANADNCAQAELRQLRDRLKKTEAEIVATRTENKNGSGMFSVEIASLKKKLIEKDIQLQKLTAELDQSKCTVDDLTLEVATLKCEQQELQQRKQQKEMEHPTVSSNCSRCNKELMDTVLMPCMHLSYCRTCANSLPNCGVCSSRITSRLKIKPDGLRQNPYLPPQ